MSLGEIQSRQLGDVQTEAAYAAKHCGHRQHQHRHVSLEKTLALKPDVLILADWQYKAIATHLPRIKAAGIPASWSISTPKPSRGTRAVRKFSANSTVRRRAPKIAAEYARGIADIQKRVARAKQSKPKIYIEFGDKGPSEYSYTSAKICGARLPTQQAATISPRLTLKTGDR